MTIPVYCTILEAYLSDELHLQQTFLKIFSYEWLYLGFPCICSHAWDKKTVKKNVKWNFIQDLKKINNKTFNKNQLRKVFTM